MAVSKSVIKSALISLYTTVESSETSKEDFADSMADIIRNAILSGDVVTTVTGTLPDGPVAASGAGSIS